MIPGPHTRNTTRFIYFKPCMHARRTPVVVRKKNLVYTLHVPIHSNGIAAITIPNPSLPPSPHHHSLVRHLRLR